MAQKQNPTETKNLSDTEVEQKIRIFKADVENPSMLKSGQTMTIDEAVWIVEAALNYTFASEHFEFSDLQIDSAFIANEITGDEINYSTVIDYYDEFALHIAELIGCDDAKFCHLVDVNFDVENSIFELATTIATKQMLKSTTAFDIFGATSYWYHGYEEGKCGAYEGDEVGNDAGKLFTRYINSYLRILNANYYFTDVYTTPNFYPEDYPGYLFYADWSERCMNPTQMNYYYGKLKELIPIVQSDFNVGTGKIPCHAYAQGDCGYYTAVHFANFSYGNFHLGSPTN